MSAISDKVYRCPTELAVTPTPLNRIVIIGSCLVSGWKAVIEASENRCPCDFFLLNNAGRLPDQPPYLPADYSFQIIQIPLRTILPEATYFRLSYNDPAAYEQLFLDTRARLLRFLDEAMRWNREHGVLTFVSNFLVPQQNPMGRLLPRYDLRNFVYFVAKLNEALDEELQSHKNTFILDIDQIAGTFGRRHLQDDVIWHIGHASALSDWDHPHDQERLERVEAASRYYPVRSEQFIVSVWNEVLANYRTIRQLDMVKLVVVDIDDTLWRGVAAERSEVSPEDIEGWPLGVVEALGHLKRRGVLLAVVSKNTEERVTPIWNRVFGNRLSLDDFAVRKINWRSKAENIEEILSEVNLLPRNVLFVDDNPRERADVQAAFPGIRAIGPNPYLWRRTILWSPETQVATVTSESANRTEMVRAQVERETMRKKMSREEFLSTLGTQVQIATIGTTDHEGFPRALELINKSNQFNTNGKRWSQQECEAAFSEHALFHIFEVRDKFTAYGIVGVVVVRESRIEQLVMSCRVVGLDVENAVIAHLLDRMRNDGYSSASASITETDANLLCRDLYKRCGFEAREGLWVRQTTPRMEMPAHIEMLA
jgi:FkbH-like protein